MPMTSETLKGLRDKVLNRLGDADVQIWTEAEIEGYVKDGYNALCKAGLLLWDLAYLENLPYTGNYNHAWEADIGFYTSSPIRTRQGRFNVTQPWELTAYRGPDSYEPLLVANHTAPWERLSGELDVTNIPAVARLPEAYLETDRVTNDFEKISPKRSVELEEEIDYETLKGRVEAYIQDKDGLRNMRKWRVPSTAASEHDYIGHYGAIAAATDGEAVTAGGMRIDEFARTADGALDASDRARMLSVGFSLPGSSSSSASGTFAGLPDLADSPIIGSRGIPVVLPGYFPIGGPWGFPVRLIEESNNFRVEHFRRGRDLDDHVFEIPRAYVKYVRHYALYRALGKDGDGQDLKLAEHYKKRYLIGLARIENRKSAIHENRAGIIGDRSPDSTRRPGRPQPPPEWNTEIWRP